jgi:hypothetical protein
MKVRDRTEAGQRGLPALEESRAERRRALVVGKVRLRSPPGQFWLWSATLIAGFAVFYWKLAQGQLESHKSQVMAKQRLVAQELGPRIVPWRDRLEVWVKELAGPWQGPHAVPDADVGAIRKGPGVYLRLLLDQARDEKSLRSAAAESLHDGFTSCLFEREAGVDPRAGPRCQSPADCAPGLLCNEYNVCARAEQPYNLRLAYRALRVLSPQWSDELHQASSDLAVTARDRDLDRVTHDDVPLALEIFSRARWFTVVLDETPPGGVPPERPDAERPETPAQRIQAVEHHARVGIWELSSGRRLLRLRDRAWARLERVGEKKELPADSVAAQQRQASSCALAMSVEEALSRAAPAPPASAGAPQPTPSSSATAP